jgi:hypothetical protein
VGKGREKEREAICGKSGGMIEKKNSKKGF